MKKRNAPIQSEDGGAWRDAVRLWLCTLLALVLMAGAAAACFAPLWPDGTAPAAPAPELDRSIRVNINKADVRALCCLPGIGQTRAEAIVAYREQNGPYGSLAELCAVNGIDLPLIISWGDMAYISDQNAEGF